MICLGQHLVIQDRWGKAGKIYTSHTRLAPYRMNALTEESSACSFVTHKVIGKNIVLVCTAAGSVISIQV